MHICTINNRIADYPQKWDELNKQQLLDVVANFSLGLSDFEFKVKTILNFLKLKASTSKPVLQHGEVLHKFKAQGRKHIWMSDTQLVTLTHSIEFLTRLQETKTGDPVYTLNSDLTTNLIPTFSYRFLTYHGPDNRLFNLVFEEYLEADNHFTAFMATNNTADLDKLVATLYRRADSTHHPKNQHYKGDRRRTFNSHLVASQARWIHHLNPDIKWAILLFYHGCRRFLALNFPHVFSGNRASNKKGYGPLSLIDALTGDDVTKNPAVRSSYLYDVMVRLERAAVKYEEIKKNRNKETT